MGRREKTKAKGRLDKFYKYAKESGYRSRAAFKLIQLNKKFEFLKNANVVIDLCSAPGGWLQVCAQLMPINSIKIGIDLVPIKHIDGCKTFMADITTQHCLSLIKNELKNQKADVVLNDGAPNVGANWSKDAFTQSELALWACQLATQVLKKGGTFVTKVFRSNDYSSLIWLFNKFFKNVTATKPEASRQVSAEIFVVCQDYIAPDFIDKKFFDVKYVFQDTERDIMEKYHDNTISSLNQLFKKKRHRSGYADDIPQHMHVKLNLSKFLEQENPFPSFYQFNQIVVDEEAKNKYLTLVEMPKEFEDMFNDIKLLGKKEVNDIVKWKKKINLKYEKQQSKLKQTEEDKENKEEKGEIESEEELDQEIKKLEHSKLNETRKERERKITQLQKHKKIADMSRNVNPLEDEQELFDYQQHNQLIDADYVDLDAKPDQEIPINKKREFKQNSFQEMNENIEFLYQEKQKRKDRIKEVEKEKKAIQEQKQWRYDHLEQKLKCRGLNTEFNKQENEEEGNEEEENEEEAEQHEQDNEMEFEDQNLPEVKKLASKKYREDEDNESEDEEMEAENDDEEIDDEKNANEQQEEEVDKSEEEESLDEDVDIENMDDDDEIQKHGMDEEFVEEIKGRKHKKQKFNKLEINDNNKEKIKEILNKKQFGKSIFNEINEELNEQAKPKEKIKSKIIKKENKKTKNRDKQKLKETKDGNDSDWSHETEKEEEYELNVPKNEMEKRRQKLKYSQKKTDKKKQKENTSDIQIVKNNSIKDQKLNMDSEEEEDDPEFKKKFEEYDLDELATNLALAKKMLRKKTREQILNDSYSRIAYDEDENLPQWFIEDEQKSNFKTVPITKEEYEAEKARLLAITYKTPKKILEAQIRRKRKLTKKLEKAKKQAEIIFNEESLSEPQKLLKIHNLYQKAKQQVKPKKKYVVSQKFKTSGPNQSKLIKAVDTRMKKDLRYKKINEKQKVNNRKIKKSKTRQKRRH